MEAFVILSRGRGYSSMGTPLPISFSDINAYYASQPIDIDFNEFLQALYGVDDVWLGKFLPVSDNDGV